MSIPDLGGNGQGVSFVGMRKKLEMGRRTKLPLTDRTATLPLGGGGGGGPTSVSISPISISLSEGNAGTTNFVYTVTRSGPTTGTSAVDWAVTGTGGNPANAADFVGSVLPSGTLNFAIGDTVKTITVPVAGDVTVETDETFTVTLSNPVSTIIGAATATGTIVNEDVGSPPGVTDNMGNNLSYQAYWVQDALLTDIGFGDFRCVGGTYDGLLPPAAYCDANGFPNSYPPGCTAFQKYFCAVPGTAALHYMAWTGTIGAGYFFKPDSIQLAGSTIRNANDCTFMPINFATGQNGAGSIAYIQYQLGAGGTYPVFGGCRPLVSDPGTTSTSTFRTMIADLKTPTAALRFTHRTGVEYNNGPSDYTTLKFPVDGDGQLFDPILTATNYNSTGNPAFVKTGNFIGRRDSFPIDWMIDICNETSCNLWLNICWNGTTAYYTALANKIFSTGGRLGTGLNAGLKCILELSNEVWNPGYTAMHQCYNEAPYRGHSISYAGLGKKTVCRLVATTNQSLTGAATIDSVAVVTNDRILVIGQTNATQNGVYLANTAGAWSRATDADATGEIQPGDIWGITAGTVYTNTTFFCTNTSNPTIGSTNITIIQFQNYHRFAEKSVEVFKCFETVFSGQLSRIVRTLCWQSVASTTIYGAMLDMPLYGGAGDTVNSHVDAIATAPYYNPASNSYTGSIAGFSALIRTAIDGTMVYAKSIYDYAVSRSKLYMNYEGGYGAVLSDATFWQTYTHDTTGVTHDDTCYFLNERRRLLGTGNMNWFDAVEQSGTTGQWGLLENITGVETPNSSRPKALANKEAVNGQYTMLDATLELSGANIYDNTPALTTVGQFTKGRLPEATCALTGAAATYFSVDNNGVLKTIGANPPAGSIGYTFTQTYANAINGPTHSQSGTIVITAAILSDNFNTAGSIDAAKWVLDSAYIPNASSNNTTGMTVPVTGGEAAFTWGSPGGAGHGLAFRSIADVDLTIYPDQIYKMGTNGADNYHRGLIFGTGSAFIYVDYANNGCQFTKWISGTFTTVASSAGKPAASWPWIRVGYSTPSGVPTISFYSAPSTANNPPQSADWVLAGSVTVASIGIATTGKVGFYCDQQFAGAIGTVLGIETYNTASG